MGATTPFWIRLPSQSCAPMVMSGPLPVGTWEVKSAWMSAKFFLTRLTFACVAASKAVAAALVADMRVSSTQTVRVVPV